MNASISSEDFELEDRASAVSGSQFKDLRAFSRVSFFQFLPHLVEVWGVVGLSIWVSWGLFPPGSGWLGGLVYLISVVVISSRQHALGVLTHDGIHFRVAENKFVNDWLTRIFLAFPNLMSLSKWRFIHFHHHRLTYKAEDPDMAIFARYPISSRKFRVLLLKDLFGFNFIRNQKYFLDLPIGWKPFNRKFFGAKRSELYLKVRDMRAFYFFWILILGVGCAVWGGEFFVVLGLYWILPYISLTQIVFRIRGALEHGAVPDREDPYEQTRTYLIHPIAGYWLSPKNVNYHLEHHLYPTVPFYRLSALHKILRETEYRGKTPFIQEFLSSLRTMVRIKAE